MKIVCAGNKEVGDKPASEVRGILEEFQGEQLKVREEKTNSLVSLMLSEVKKARVDFSF